VYDGSSSSSRPRTRDGTDDWRSTTTRSGNRQTVAIGSGAVSMYEITGDSMDGLMDGRTTFIHMHAQTHVVARQHRAEPRHGESCTTKGGGHAPANAAAAAAERCCSWVCNIVASNSHQRHARDAPKHRMP